MGRSSNSALTSANPVEPLDDRHQHLTIARVPLYFALDHPHSPVAAPSRIRLEQLPAARHADPADHALLLMPAGSDDWRRGASRFLQVIAAEFFSCSSSSDEIKTH